MSNHSLQSKWRSKEIPSFLEIEWTDSFTEDGWLSANDLTLEDELVLTRGFLVAEDDNLVRLTHSISEDDSILGHVTIPKSCILNRRVIE